MLSSYHDNMRPTSLDCIKILRHMPEETKVTLFFKEQFDQWLSYGSHGLPVWTKFFLLAEGYYCVEKQT